MANGSRSATSVSSKTNHYSPRSEFRYQFEANRTFSREGRRPRTTPTRNVAIGKQKHFHPAAEDIIAMAQSPSSSFIDESFGGSLMMLQKGYTKVKPEKFLELQKLSNQPTPTPLTSPRTEISTPRLVKHLAEKMGIGNYKQEQGFVDSSNHASKETQYNYPHESPLSSRHSSKRPISSEWTPTELKRAQWSHATKNEFTERCVRCSEFPDIQIEGRSLSKILTNDNTTMAKEHCEVLGPDSCPDCVKIRSQKHHEEHCMKNTPATSGDVYKLVLVHEKIPSLSVREVRRKLLDGEISDEVLCVPRWPEIDTSAILHQTVNAEEESGERPSFQPKIYNNTNLGKRCGIKSLKSFKHIGAPMFGTIHEGSETQSFFEEDKMPSKDMSTNKQKMNEMLFRQHSSEKTHKIKIFPASENTYFSEENNEEKLKLNSSIKSQGKVKSEENRFTSVQKVDNWNQADAIEFDNSADFMSKPCKQRRYFTLDVVPSQNFFFDIADLAERLHYADLSATKQQQRSQADEFLKTLSATISPPHIKVVDTSKMADTDSVTSSDSLKQRDTEFNMAYQPPTFFGSEKRFQYNTKDGPSSDNQSQINHKADVAFATGPALFRAPRFLIP